MSDRYSAGSELSKLLIALLNHAFTALAADESRLLESGDRSKRLFFPDGVGGISVGLTVNGESASLAISSAAAPVCKPGSQGSAHPMDVNPRWAANSGSTYTVAVYEKPSLGPKRQLGYEQKIDPDTGPQTVDLDKVSAG